MPGFFSSIRHLNFRKQKTKVGSTFSDYLNILFGVPQGPIAGPLFSMFTLANTFFQIDSSEFSSYADDNSFFASAQNHEKLIKSLQSTLNCVFEWYQENYFKANADKCHLFLSPFSNKEMTLANCKIASRNSEELLGVVIDSEVTFAKHIENLCWKTNQKLHALTRVINFKTLEKRRLVMKTFVFSQFNYCPLVWMCHSRKCNNKINRLQERALCIVYNDKNSTFYQLLEKDKSVTIHTRNLQYLATEIFKVKIGISPIIMTKIFRFCDNTTHNLRSDQVLERKHNRTTNFGVESISTLGAKMWALVPENLRQ